MEVNTISDYLNVSTPLPQYLPYARFLLNANLSHTAKLLYTLLLDRVTLSQKSSWVDERGFVYVIFPLSSLSKALQCSTMSVKRALRTFDGEPVTHTDKGQSRYNRNTWMGGLSLVIADIHTIHGQSSENRPTRT